MPPSYNYTDEKLEKIINSLSPTFKNVLELRHASWWREDVYKKLAEHCITFCGMSHPTLPDDVIQNTGEVYYRFHGVPDLYRSRYSIEFLQKIVDSVKHNSAAKEVWCYCNNDGEATGVFKAKEIIGMI